MKTVIDDSFEFKLINFGGRDIYFQFEVNDTEIIIPVECLEHIHNQIARAKYEMGNLKELLNKSK